MSLYARTGSCLTKEEIAQVAIASATDAKGKGRDRSKSGNSVASSATTKSKLKSLVKKRMSAVCRGDNNNEACWLQSPFVQRDKQLAAALEPALRPLQPLQWSKNSHEWLNTFDIDKVMVQYEGSFKRFKYFGAHPSDYVGERPYPPGNPLSTLNVKDFVRRGFTELGVVFNLDTHSQPGSHWVACFASFDRTSPKFGIAYYDSGGLVLPPLPIMSFMLRVKAQAQEALQAGKGRAGRRFGIWMNDVQHQYKNTECGMFAMLFIISCLEHKGESYTATRKRIGRDEHAFQFRSRLYSPNLRSLMRRQGR